MAHLESRNRHRFLAFQERLRLSKNKELEPLLTLLAQCQEGLELDSSMDLSADGTTFLNSSTRTPFGKSSVLRSQSSNALRQPGVEFVPFFV